MENQEEMSVFKGNNGQLERTKVRFSGASKEQRRRAQKAQTLKRSSINGEALKKLLMYITFCIGTCKNVKDKCA